MIRFATVVGLAMFLAAGSVTLAFHDGGVAYCEGCHTMHNSVDGQTATQHGHGGGGTVGTGHNSFLTIGTDPSSTCLNCHYEIYKVMSTDGSAMTPGGDFFYLNVNYTGPRYSSPGQSHGHNIIAADFGTTQETTLNEAPNNGTVHYQSAWLGCNSCHDPHGKIANNLNPAPISASGSYGSPAPTNGSILGNYRLLGGLGYDGGEQAVGINFVNPAPVARAYAGASGVWPTETDTRHVDYGSGMSEWCVNCHRGFDAEGATSHRHPASNTAHIDAFASNYNAYVCTGNLTGNAATSFLALIPFERGVSDSTQLNTARTDGPDANANVMCLTCHRAHASAFSDAGRWDFTCEFMNTSPQLTSPQANYVYYGRNIATQFGQFQRNLCNKCHLQD